MAWVCCAVSCCAVSCRCTCCAAHDETDTGPGLSTVQSGFWRSHCWVSDQGLRPLIGAFLSSRCGPPGSPMGRLSCLPVCVYLLVMEMRWQISCASCQISFAVLMPGSLALTSLHSPWCAACQPAGNQHVRLLSLLVQRLLDRF